jgi:multidrug efflux system membrane fusion protein
MDERVDPLSADAGRPQAFLAEPATPSRQRGRVIIWLVWLIVLGAMGAGGWYWWHARSVTQTAARPAAGRAGAGGPPQPVGAATIDTGDIHVVLNELGTVTSLATVTVKTQISGQLTEIGFKEGQIVHKGDFLAQVDDRPYKVALEQAQGTLAHDQGLLGQAQSDLKRYQTLGRQDSIAQQQLDDQRFIVAQYTGTVQADQGQVDNAKLNIAYCHIVSPIDGQVGLRQVDAGNYVQTSDANGVVVLTEMTPISVLFSVPEDALPDILAQLHAGQKLPVDAYDRANTTKLASGMLDTLDNQIDTTTGTVKLRAQFDNKEGGLYPNQFVNARLLVRTLAKTVRVPTSAVQRGEPGTFVYVIKPDNTVSVVPVTLGPTDGAFAAVTKGLAVGDRVVTDGTDRLRDGAAVTVPVPGANGAPPAGAPRTPRAPRPASP